MRQNTMVGQLSGSNLVADKMLYAFLFRTSRYNTFAEKMNALQFAPTVYASSNSIYSASYLTFELAPGGRVENFEDSELFGYRSAKGWVPAMLNPQPLPPISTEYPHEAWVAQHVYNPLLETWPVT